MLTSFFAMKSDFYKNGDKTNKIREICYQIYVVTVAEDRE